MTLSKEDQQILDLLEEAGKQYENYLKITEVTSLMTSDEPITEELAYTWDRPLTLALSKDR